MAKRSKTKYIVWMEDWSGLAFKDDNDPTVDDFDYALPIIYQEKDPDKKAEKLQAVMLDQPARGVRTIG